MPVFPKVSSITFAQRMPNLSLRKLSWQLESITSRYITKRRNNCFQVLGEIAAIHISLVSLRKPWEVWVGGSQETHGSPGSHKDPWRIGRKHKSLKYEVMMMETHLNVLW
jgi:hypothetical protein